MKEIIRLLLLDMRIFDTNWDMALNAMSEDELKAEYEHICAEAGIEVEG